MYVQLATSTLVESNYLLDKDNNTIAALQRPRTG